jgi:hypothetical protein
MENELSAWNREVSGCSDLELMARVQRLTAADQRLVARLIVYLGEVETRGLYRERAYGSMFEFLVEELRMSEAEAYLRLQAARLAQKYPVIISLLATGAVHLSALRQISRFLTPDNHVELLERVRGKSKREVEKLVAELDPKPEVPSQMRRLPQPALSGKVAAARPHASVPSAQQLMAASGPAADTGAANTSAAPVAPEARAACASTDDFTLEVPPLKRSSCAALGPGSYRLQVTVHQALHDKLEQLKQLLRHQVPDADLATIIERAVDLLLAKTLKGRFAVKEPSQKATSTTASTSTTRVSGLETEVPSGLVGATKTPKRNSRYIPRAVVREVYARDQGQCSFVGSNGKRCSERGLLELHHIHPFARGGEATVGNLRLVCRTHNTLFAEYDFGRAHMQSKRSQAQGLT